MSGSSTQTQNNSSSPWAPQAGYIDQAFQGAASALNQSNANGAANAPKNFVASYSPAAFQTYADMISAGNNNTVPSWLTNAGIGAGNSGAAGATGALTDLGGFNPASTNNTGAVLGAADAYANNPAIPGEVQAALQAAKETAQDVTLPGITAGAAGTNNVNSNRTAISQGLVDRGLSEQAGNIAAELEGNAWNTGVNTAESELQSNNANRIASLTGAGGLGLNLFGAGSGDVGNSVNAESGLYGIASGGASQQQQANQAPLSNQLQKWQFGTQSPFAGLDQAYNIWGGTNWGGTQQGTTTTNPSIYSIIGGLLGGAGSAATGAGTVYKALGPSTAAAAAAA